MNNQIDIENMILSSFLFSAYTEQELDTFMLDTGRFTSPFRVHVATQINKETSSDKMYDFQSVDIEENLNNNTEVAEWINILSQKPMALTVAKRLYNKLTDTRGSRI